MYFYSRNLSEFGKLIAVSIETLLSFCDDEEPDVRLVAGDCVNRIIKVAFNIIVNSQGNEAHQGVTMLPVTGFVAALPLVLLQ